MNWMTCTHKEMVEAAKKASKTLETAMDFSEKKWRAFSRHRYYDYYDIIRRDVRDGSSTAALDGSSTCPLCYRYRKCRKCPLNRKGDKETCCEEYRDRWKDNGHALYLYIRRENRKLKRKARDGKKEVRD